ncbi:nitric oxide dioxygenase [Evansella caseinilytica]|uniref:Flavohemoprotein n=1 Tax=Evansella caseinilytica TaxID=1503961 RepID=A0A1H3ICQ5_9BACI|nr:NO-inducible flavohemoprotein [Evansella caseinilytica]SDY25407.1 nitric oxide dioxygenase [Evansella caseinilytica]
MTTTATKLDERTIEIVKSTAPVLAQHGESITKRFYEMMFANHPELLNVFNHANQKQGKQPRALANTVYAAAQHIDNLEAILPVVKQIAHKHRSLEIKADQYPIVGKHLLLAIKDVLGDAATDEIIDAWGKAYGVIADVFIQVEREMYEAAAKKNGGWNGFREFLVQKKVKESDVITSFYLKAKDGEAISDFLPGQYVSVRCPISGEKYTHIRQYSLSAAPGKDHYRISVKREADDYSPDGIVSNYLHSQVKEGDVIEVTAPAGDFVLNMDSDERVVLISGGVGLTPMVSMLHSLVESQPDRNVRFIHAAINGQTHAMHDEVKHIAARHDNAAYYVCYEKPTEKDRAERRFDKEGYIDLAWLQSILKDNSGDFYFCGPSPFMKAINKALTDWNVPAEKIHFEFFGPADQL